jgi:hypothetical protein
MFDFLPEHWQIIKSYAGIYHVRTDWDLMKLDNRMITIILGYVSPKFTKNIDFKSNKQRIKCIWKYLHKLKLYNVHKLIENQIKTNITNQKELYIL